VDSFGFEWDLDLQNGNLTGTVDTGTTGVWNVSGTESCSNRTMRADNPNPDGCTFATDYFIYTGTVTYQGDGSYTYSGNWTSYCFDQPLSTGTFSGTGTPGACTAPRLREPVPGSPAVNPRAPAALALPVEGYGLAGHPNPSTSSATIRFGLRERAEVRLAVYDGLGREVAVLADEQMEAGHYEVVFDGRELAAGVYVVRLDVGGRLQTERVTLLK
jgi:hypothetical protein